MSQPDRRHRRPAERGQVHAVQPHLGVAVRPSCSDRGRHHPRPPLRRRRVERPAVLARRHRWPGARLGTTSMDQAIRQQVETRDRRGRPHPLRRGRQGRPAPDRRARSPSGCAQPKRPVLLVVNKVDDLERATAQYEFYELGLGDPFAVSAGVGKGSGDLLDELVELAAARASRRSRDDQGRRGRPAERRQVVARQPAARRGAARGGADGRHDARRDRHALDATTTALHLHRHRRPPPPRARWTRTSSSTRRCAPQRAIERASVCVLVVDATLTACTTRTCASRPRRGSRGAGSSSLVNKWDLVDEKDAKTAARGEKQLHREGAVPRVRAVPLRLGAHRTARAQGARPDPRGGGGAGASASRPPK